ncbi:MAG: hypothetical protein BroJett040_22750 [Oligoflexia bacterium]|nr:MAG: hypothetical protein BroJett040_22750 [Oligoflexia bacterium]
MKTQLSTFYLGPYFFGLDVKRVQEIIRFHEISPVPLAPPVISGLINLRGDIVTAIDLGLRLEIEEDRVIDKEMQMNVVIRTEENSVSLVVDRVGDIIEVEEGQYEKPPETLKGSAKELIVGTYKLEDRLLLLLDIDKIIQI